MPKKKRNLSRRKINDKSVNFSAYHHKFSAKINRILPLASRSSSILMERDVLGRSDSTVLIDFLNELTESKFAENAIDPTVRIQVFKLG